MKIYREMDIEDFNFWSSARDRMDAIKDAGIEEEAFDIIREVFAEEEYVDETAINDFVWFELDDELEERGLYDPKTGEYGEHEEEEDEDEEDDWDDEEEDEDDDEDEDW